MLVLNNSVSSFLDEVCKQIKYKKIHKEISTEIQDHINQLMEEYKEYGMSEEEAVEKAVKQMGSPVEIGKELHKTHRPKTEWSIVILLVAMVLIGGGVLVSIANDGAAFLPIGRFIFTYIIYVTLGIAACVGFYFFDITKLERYSLIIFAVTLIFLFESTRLSYRINNLPYIRIGGFLNFRPVTLVMPFFIVSFAGLLNRWMTGSIINLLKLLFLGMMVVLGCILQPSFADAMLIGCSFLVMITLAVTSNKFKGNKMIFLSSIYGSVVLGAGLILLKIIVVPYRLARLLVFLNPKLDPHGYGYVNSLLAKILHGAKLIGKGDSFYLNMNGKGVPVYLAGLRSEYIFTYIISTFGWLAGIFLVTVLTLMIMRMFNATKNIHNIYGKYVASSIVTVYSIEVILSTLMSIGMFPGLGISLPFISYGGVEFIINMSLLGVLLGIYRRKDLKIANGYA